MRAVVAQDLAGVKADDGSRTLLERALEIGVRAEGKVDVQVDITLLNLAAVPRQQEDFPRAQALFEKALAIDEQAYCFFRVSAARLLPRC